MKKTAATTILDVATLMAMALIVMFPSMSWAIGTWPTPEKPFYWLDMFFRIFIPF